MGKFDKSPIRVTYRVGVFVDAENVRIACREKWGRGINYGKLMQVALAGHSLYRGFAYAIQRDDTIDRWIREVEVYGFEVKVKKLVRHSDGRENASCHGELVPDVLWMLDLVDMVVIVSGSDDYVPPVKCCHERGKIARVIGVDSATNKDLKAAADEFVPITEDMLLRPKTKQQQ